MIIYLAKQTIIDINREAVKLRDDPFAVQNEANLDYLVNSIEYKYSEKAEEDAILLKAAFLLHFIANKAHIFAEGNKRTAITSTLLFLGINSIKVDDLNQDELVEFVLEVARGNVSMSNIVKWFSQRVKKHEKL